MKRIILLIQFLTRIPININLNVTKEDLSKAVIYFPVVGWIIGGLLWAIFVLSHQILGMDIFIVAGFIVLAESVITGGLHLDGLSDTFDGIFSGRKRERILDIMKDPNVGTFGVLSLVFLIIIKILLLAKIQKDLLVVILLMPVFSRFCVVMASRYNKYAKDDGLGNMFIGKVSNLQLAISLIMTLIGLYLSRYLYLGFIVSIFFTFYFTKMINRKINGITGDTLGAIVELNELVFLMSVYLMEVI